MKEGWRLDALCAQTDPEIFHPEKGGSTKAAKSICARCPVQKQCLAYALDNRIVWGVWGGFSDRERRHLRSERRTA